MAEIPIICLRWNRRSRLDCVSALIIFDIHWQLFDETSNRAAFVANDVGLKLSSSHIRDSSNDSIIACTRLLPQRRTITITFATSLRSLRSSKAWPGLGAPGKIVGSWTLSRILTLSKTVNDRVSLRPPTSSLQPSHVPAGQQSKIHSTASDVTVRRCRG